jgi:broad specificity phosphatase PhoE
VKRLVLVRHAHRDTSDRGADNGLTRKGRRQAEAVRRFFKARFGKEKALLLSSPKRRCLETLEPLAEKAGLRLRADGRLMELLPPEPAGGLEKRIDDFFDRWEKKGPALTVACSHGDWISKALGRRAAARVDLKKGGWAEVVLEEGKGARLEWLLQELPLKKR